MGELESNLEKSAEKKGLTGEAKHQYVGGAIHNIKAKKGLFFLKSPVSSPAPAAKKKPEPKAKKPLFKKPAPAPKKKEEKKEEPKQKYYIQLTRHTGIQGYGKAQRLIEDQTPEQVQEWLQNSPTSIYKSFKVYKEGTNELVRSATGTKEDPYWKIIKRGTGAKK